MTEDVPGARSFSIGCFVGVGSRHESARLHGVSHFLEHVLFKGTRRRSAEQISAEIETVGGDINAYTTREYTCFHARVLAEDAELATDVLVDMLTGSLLTGQDVDAEREVILDEIDMHADEPGDVAWDLSMAANFPGGALGRTVIGTPESIRSLGRRQIRDFWRRRYQPDQVVVAAAGAVDHDLLVDALGGWQPASSTPTAPTRRPRRESARHGSRRHVRRDIEQVHAVLSFPGLATNDPDVPALGVFTTVLGGGMSSRLFLEVRERRGLTYSIDASDLSFSDTGVWAIEWTCSPRRLDEVLQIVRDTCHTVARDGVTDDELHRATGQIRGAFLLSAESIDNRMSRLGVGELTGDRRSIDELVAAHRAVSTEDVHRVAQRALMDPTMVLVGPQPGTGLGWA